MPKSAVFASLMDDPLDRSQGAKLAFGSNLGSVVQQQSGSSAHRGVTQEEKPSSSSLVQRCCPRKLVTFERENLFL